MPEVVPVKPRMTYPDGTGYQRGLYTFSTLPSEVANILETEFLKRADDGASLALTRLLTGDANLDEAARSAWSRFIMTLLHRNPERIEQITVRIAVEYPKRLAEVLSDAHIEHLTLRMLHRIMDSEFLGAALNRMLLMVINFDSSHRHLLTSDRPIVMTNGLNKPDSHLIMPISPRHVVVLANDGDMLRYFDELARTGGMVGRMNNRMARQARKFVYGTDHRDLKFIEARLGEKAEWSPLE